MRLNKIVSISLLGILAISGVLSLMHPSSANTPLTLCNKWEWGVDLNDFIGFEVNQSYMGYQAPTSFVGFNVSSFGIYQLFDWIWADYLNLTEYGINPDTGKLEPLEESVISIYVNDTTDLDYNVYQSGHETNTGFMISPNLVVPLNATTHSLDLNFWVWCMMNYIDSFYYTYEIDNNDMYEVNGNTIHIWDVSGESDCNMTYLADGTLESAQMLLVDKDYTPDKVIMQNYTRIYDATKINCLDQTSFSYNLGDELFYKEDVTGSIQFSQYQKYKVVDFTIEPLTYHPQIPFSMPFECLYTANYVYYPTAGWMLSSSSIMAGAANNEINCLLSNYGYIMKMGTTGSDIFNMYLPFIGEEFDIFTTTTNSIKAENSTSLEWWYMELSPQYSIKNMTYYMDIQGDSQKELVSQILLASDPYPSTQNPGSTTNGEEDDDDEDEEKEDIFEIPGFPIEIMCALSLFGVISLFRKKRINTIY